MNRDSTVRTEQRSDAALEFARRAHEGQRRKQTGVPFIEHPVAVARLLADAGCDDTLIAAAYLHDAVEKTDTDLAQVEEGFGPDVSRLVEALTDDPKISDYAERKRTLRGKALAGGPDAALIYAADRVANMRDWLSLEPAERGACAERLGTSLEERLQLWQEDLSELTAFDSELRFLAEIELALRELRADPA